MSISSSGPIGMPNVQRGLVDLLPRLALLQPPHGLHHVGRRARG